MKKWVKRIPIMILTMALMIALMPVQALASDTNDTLQNIPVELSDGENSVLQGNAAIKLTDKKYESLLNTGGHTARITGKVGDKLEGLTPSEIATTMDEGYGVAELYLVDINGIKNESFGTSGTTIRGTLTVPIPEGCFATGAKRIYNWAWNMNHEPDYEKVDVTVNADGTISFPVVMWSVHDFYDETNSLSGAYVVEFLKIKTDIATLKDNAKTEKTNYEYTGAAINPTVTVGNLTKDTDFTVAYANNTNAGSAKAIVTGKGSYTGTIEIPFTIDPMSIQKKKADAKLEKTECDYTGKAIEPEVTVGNLKKGTDYSVEYANNVEPGTATATVKGLGNYNGSFALEYKINGKAADEKPTEIKDETGADYTIDNSGETSEASYEAAKSKKEKTVKVPDTVTLDDGTKVKVTSIANNAFKGNKKLTKATIGKNVKTVGDNAFNGCSKLSNLKFGKSVEKIGKGACKNCKNLKNVTLPASTKTIGKSAFDGASNLKVITINCKNLKSVGKNAFRNIDPYAVIKLKGNAKQKKAAEKLITKKGTGYKNTMKIKK